MLVPSLVPAGVETFENLNFGPQHKKTKKTEATFEFWAPKRDFCGPQAHKTGPFCYFFFYLKNDARGPNFGPQNFRKGSIIFEIEPAKAALVNILSKILICGPKPKIFGPEAQNFF